MATQVKFYSFIRDIGLGVHNLNTHTLRVYLSNGSPNAATHENKSDVAEISGGNGYTAGGYDINNTYSMSGAVGQMAATDVTITASGGTIGPFRYAVIYNDDTTGDKLVSYADYGSSITLNPGESFVIDFASPAAIDIQ